MNFETLLLTIIAILCLFIGLGIIFNQGFTGRFVRERFRGKLWQRILGSEKRAMMVYVAMLVHLCLYSASELESTRF